MKSIVIVGNSGEAINSKKGSLVDSCDIVIRLNNFETEGYEEDIGSKTDIIVCAFSSLVKICNPQKYPEYCHHDLTEKVIFWSARKLVGDKLARCKSLLGNVTVNQPSNNQWKRALNGAYKNFWRQQPSTGLITIEMALDLFPNDKIFIHGFDNKVEKTHYFDKNYLDKDYPGDPCGHNWIGEWKYIQLIIESKKITIM